MTGTARPKISAVFNTLNEERRLPFSLASVKPWVDEIVVVDMDSDDRTVEIATEAGARVFRHERLGYADPARAYAIERAQGDWILVLDADELVPARLAKRLIEIATADQVDVVRIPMVNHLFGASLRGTGWGPHQDTHLRFFRRGSVRATGEIHNYLHVADEARVLEFEATDGLCLVHYNYLDVQQFMEKLNRYTDIEAADLVARGKRFSYLGSVRWSAREFLRRYLRQRGYRDGWRGFYLAWLMAGYRMITAAKVEQIRRAGERARIEDEYARDAERLLAEYDDFTLHR
jgi:glycosyltransferase involved in cell wall biosynthesis